MMLITVSSIRPSPISSPCTAVRLIRWWWCWISTRWINVVLSDLIYLDGWLSIHHRSCRQWKTTRKCHLYSSAYLLCTSLPRCSLNEPPGWYWRESTTLFNNWLTESIQIHLLLLKLNFISWQEKKICRQRSRRSSSLDLVRSSDTDDGSRS